MDEGSTFAEVNLNSAQIEGQLSLRQSTVTGTLSMDSLRVGQSLLMREEGTFAEVNLRGAQIEDQLDLSQSTVTDLLSMDGLRVGQNLFMRDRATFAEVMLNSAQIEGLLDLSQSTVTGLLSMYSLRVGQSLLMRDGNFAQNHPTHTIDLAFSSIGSNLDLSGASLPSLNLTGATIEGELRLAMGSVPRWKSSALLNLQNTKAEALHGALEVRQEMHKAEALAAWPDTLELNGFTYDRLGGLGAGSTNSMAEYKVSWLKHWLRKQSCYSPQPYEQLARVLQQAGYKTKARAILFASKRREHKETTRWLSSAWWGLTLQQILIGYGYHNFWVLGWVFFFCIMGTVILCWSGQGPTPKPHSVFAANTDRLVFPTYFTPLPQRCYWLGCRSGPIMFDNIAYSLDRFLPIIQFQKTHEDVTSMPISSGGMF
jgi:hypothetical protein